MKTVYMADDGTQFDNKYDCEDYEFGMKMKLPKSGLKFKNLFGTELSRIHSEQTYMDANIIEAPTKEDVELLHKIAEVAGFELYLEINSPGVWIWYGPTRSFKKFLDL